MQTCANSTYVARKRDRIIVVINIQRGIYMLLNGFAFAHLIPSCTKQTHKLRAQWKWWRGTERRKEGARSHGELCVIQNAIRCFTSVSTLPEDGHVSVKHLNTLSITNMSFGARATVTSAISGQSSLAHTAQRFSAACAQCVCVCPNKFYAWQFCSFRGIVSREIQSAKFLRLSYIRLSETNGLARASLLILCMRNIRPAQTNET